MNKQILIGLVGLVAVVAVVVYVKNKQTSSEPHWSIAPPQPTPLSYLGTDPRSGYRV